MCVFESKRGRWACFGDWSVRGLGGCMGVMDWVYVGGVCVRGLVVCGRCVCVYEDLGV